MSDPSFPVPTKDAARRADSLVDEGYALHRSGDYRGAEVSYRRALQIQPDNPDALHFLGLILASSGQLDGAISLMRKAIEVRPDFDLAYFNLGNALRQAGRINEAVEAFSASVRLKPDAPNAWLNLGATRSAQGDLDGAVQAYLQAIAFRPQNPEAYYNLGCVQQRLGKLQEACDAYRRAIALNPAHADALANLGASLLALDRPLEALPAFRKRAALEPRSSEAQVALSANLLALGRPTEAAEAGRNALALSPDEPAAWTSLANALRELGKSEDALAAYQQAAKFSPLEAGAHVNLAIGLQEAGDANKAAAAIDTALALDPASAGAWLVKSGLKRFSSGDPDLATLQALLAAHPNETADSRVQLEFALGKAFMDIGDVDAAFSHLSAGNALQRQRIDYDAERERLCLDAAASAPVSLPSRVSEESESVSALPVFIVGMPRSGTTLIEQILASHPLIFGAGELPTLERLLSAQLGSKWAPDHRVEALQRLPSQTLAEIGELYLRELRDLAPSAARVTDKMPSNFRFIGQILEMLPHARIVHCRRDAMDTCFSCYTAKFTRGQEFSYDLRELGAYYQSYQRLMQRWRRDAPSNRFIEIDYEDVVEDLETQARRLIAFCGLDWDDACLSFNETRRQVRTASVNQVRQPLYRTSVGRWKPYEGYLAPLAEALAFRPAAEATRAHKP